VAAVIQLLAVYLDAAEVVAILQESSEFFYRGFMPGVARLLVIEGNDPCDGLAATQEYQALSGFDLCDTGGEVLIGFAKRYSAHGNPL
jgi:hypothetical protein